MFLSNWSALLGLACILFLASCGSGPTNGNNGPVILPHVDGGFPFSIKEPEVFQANFIVTAEGREKQWFLAKSNDRWRLDIIKNGARSLTQIRTDRLYLIDHVSRTYAAEPQAKGPFEPPDPMLTGFFRGKEHNEFKEQGTEGNYKKFHVIWDGGAKDDIFILVDEPSGMIVKQDFYEGTGEHARITLSYEVRDLTLNVDDVLFALPAGYTLVDYDWLRQQRQDVSDK